MNEIGELLRTTREESGVSLEEASGDLEIKTLILENIEDGNIGCFKDIFVLKDYIYDYAKYLGLEPDKLIALGVLVVLIIIWSVRQIAVDNMTTNIVSYGDSYE